MVDEKIVKMEKELAVMNLSLDAIAKTLDKMSNVHVDMVVLQERWHGMDKELIESFARVHKRIDQVQERLDEEAAHRIWALKIFIGAIITAVAAFIIKGGLV